MTTQKTVDELDHPCKQSCSGWKQGYEKGVASLTAQLAIARETLGLIASPKRNDGTYNRDRDACQALAQDALGKLKKAGCEK